MTAMAFILVPVYEVCTNIVVSCFLFFGDIFDVKLPFK